MNTFREEANEVLAAVGEPPLGGSDVLVGGQLADGSAIEETRPGIALVEPEGFKRSDMVFTNGRRLVLDMAKDDAIAAIRAFTADVEPDFLELDTIDVVGEDKATAVIYRNRVFLTRRAVELVQTVGDFWTKHVPGRLMNEGASPSTDPAILDLRMNAAQAKRMRKMGR